MEINRKEAAALSKVLCEGMPDNQKQRDFLAKINHKLELFAKKGIQTI